MAAWQAAPARASAAPLPAAPFAPVAANPAVAPARAAEGSATRAHPFAELLRQSRDDGVVHQQKVPTPPAEESCVNSESDEQPSTPTTPMKAKPRPAPTMTPKTASSAHASDPEERIRHDKEAGGSQEADGSATAAPDDAHADGWIAQTLAGGATPPVPSERADGARGRIGGTGQDADIDAAQVDLAATGSGPRGGRNDARGSARADPNDARLTARVLGGADADPETRTQMLPAAFAEAFRASDSVAQRPGAEAHIDALAPAFAAGGSSATGEAPAAAAPTELSLPTPIDSPDFGAAFGVQVSVLAKDGVQQAELHLNPTETGPVSIQIALDGNEARIDFGADLAATRAAIERSLPELAAALRDAGFTLTGGGVSQHAGGRAGDDEESSSPRTGLRSNPVEGAVPAPPATRRVAAGGVDLYA